MSCIFRVLSLLPSSCPPFSPSPPLLSSHRSPSHLAGARAWCLSSFGPPPPTALRPSSTHIDAKFRREFGSWEKNSAYFFSAGRGGVHVEKLGAGSNVCICLACQKHEAGSQARRPRPHPLPPPQGWGGEERRRQRAKVSPPHPWGGGRGWGLTQPQRRR